VNGQGRRPAAVLKGKDMMIEDRYLVGFDEHAYTVLGKNMCGKISTAVPLSLKEARAEVARLVSTNPCLEPVVFKIDLVAALKRA
jgi:hypothetical protein